MLIVPPSYQTFSGPLIFLAGPIRGSVDWQKQAIETISKSGINIASPRRYESEFTRFSEEKFHEQMDWETHHLRCAGKHGVILFWLAKRTTPLTEEFAFAQTTRFELAEWMMRHIKDKASLVVGIEEGFTGAEYIRRRFSQDCPDVKIFDNLEETCKEAIRICDGL